MGPLKTTDLYGMSKEELKNRLKDVKNAKNNKTAINKKSEIKVSKKPTENLSDKTSEKNKKLYQKSTKSNSIKNDDTVGVRGILNKNDFESDDVDTSCTGKTELEHDKSLINESVKYDSTDLVISFDTTGSMYSVLTQVRQNINELVKNMMNDVSDLRIAIIAHGDYCDKDRPYTIRILDFTDNVDDITNFVANTEATSGGDADECYELVLNAVHSMLNWRTNVNKALVMIGDSNPHDSSYILNKDRLDWLNEAKTLGYNNIRIIAVHALSFYRQNSKKFYETISKVTNGTYLTLDQFKDVENLLLATCCAQNGIEKLTEFVEIIRNSHSMTNNMARNINRLAGKQLVDELFSDDYFTSRVSGSKTTTTGRRITDDTRVQKDGLVPVVPGRFQTMTVDDNCAIKQFVTKNGLKFKIGRGFYELSKAEDVQQYKEVLLQNKETGLMYNGAQVREYLGLQPQIAKGGVTERLYFDKNREYRVFVQSTSVNRKLIGGTEFLYEIEDI